MYLIGHLAEGENEENIWIKASGKVIKYKSNQNKAVYRLEEIGLKLGRVLQ